MEAFAAAAIQTLVDKLSSRALEWWESESGLKDELQTLKDTLDKVQSVIDVAEEKEAKPESLVKLLRRLKDVAYDAEDLVDKFEYQGLKMIAEASHPSPSKGKRIKDWVSSSSLSLKRSESSGSTSKSPTADEIKKIVDRLESIYTGVKEIVGLLKNNRSKQHVTSKKRVTTSTLEKGNFHGRDEVREQIIKKLLLDSGDESGSGSVVGNVSVIPIVGMGGMGKTTLAQHVHNDKRVVEHFKRRVWVYVSQNFDEEKITRDMIQQLSGDTPHGLDSMSLQSLQQQLIKVLKGIRFMLVLDDVWSDEWTRLLNPLEYGEKGSNVLVTCREEKDLGAMGIKANKILLRDLEKEACRSLFMEHAFQGINSNDSDFGMLTHIGNQIAEKLTGSPLEAKVVGGMLNRDVDKDHWNSIWENGIWKKLGSNENRIDAVLKLSYDRLAPPLQQCFAYCSVFPKGYCFDKDELVRKWIALDFIRKERNKRMEDTGSEYFDDLLYSSFFSSPYGKKEYVMHDLMNDLSMSVSKDECFRIEGDDGLPEIPSSVRHLSLRTKHLAKLTRCRLEKLRSFLLLGPQYEFDFNHALLLDTVKKLKHVRVLVLLDVKPWSINININKEQMNGLLIAFGELIHLRYLGSWTDKIDAFPESIWKHYHLQVLDLYGTKGIDVPEGLKNALISLRHIVPKDLIYFSKFGHLTSLQELAFKVQKKSGHEILSQLKDMTELEKLEIRNLENVEVKREVLTDQAKLKEKKYLAELSLYWDDSEREPMSEEQEEFVLEGLHPHPNIKRLYIEGYGGSKSPTWIQGLSKLKLLSLKQCRHLEVLPPIVQLGSLKGLKIVDCSELKLVPTLPLSLRELEIVRTGLIALPRVAESSSSIASSSSSSSSSSSLSRLHVWGCHNLNSLGESLLQQHHLTALQELYIRDYQGLTSLGGLRSLIFLKRLEIRGCPKLTVNLPDEDVSLPSSLEELGINNGGDLDKLLPRYLQNLTSLSKLFIEECPQIASLPSVEVTCQVLSLEELDIDGCEQLISLGGLQAVVSLKRLKIRNCPKLTATSPLPSSLVDLKMSNNCGELDESLPRYLENLTSLSSLKICFCQQITSLPKAAQLHHLIALKELIIRDCEELKSLEGLEALVSLEELSLEYCPKITAAASFSFPLLGEKEEEGLSCLQRLTISDISLLTAPLLRKTLTSLRQLVLYYCPQRTSFTDEEEELFRDLTSLQVLRFRQCETLPSLPKVLQSLSCLEELEIWDCPGLKSLPDNGLPTSLTKLSISNCGMLLKDRCQEGGDDWHKIAHIVNKDFEW